MDGTILRVLRAEASRRRDEAGDPKVRLADLADAAGISIVYVSQMERGERPVHPEQYARMARLLALDTEHRRRVKPYWALATVETDRRNDQTVELLADGDGTVYIYPFDSMHLAISARDAVAGYEGAVLGPGIDLVPVTTEYAESAGTVEEITSNLGYAKHVVSVIVGMVEKPRRTTTTGSTRRSTPKKSKAPPVVERATS
jgi:transcriptional regulator with XRE-family HTH domain